MTLLWVKAAWKYRNEIAIGIIVVILSLGAVYIRHVFNERTRLEERVATLTAEMENVKKQMTLNKDIADAIQRIKVQSNNYVRVVETTPSPTTGSSFVAVPSGLFNPTNLLSTSTFRNTSTSNARAKDK